MDIKLRANLSAYSKVDSLSRVINKAQYSDFDTLFEEEQDNIVTKDTIDTLFPTEKEQPLVSKQEIDSLFRTEGNSATVSFSEIDSLFK